MSVCPCYTFSSYIFSGFCFLPSVSSNHLVSFIQPRPCNFSFLLWFCIGTNVSMFLRLFQLSENQLLHFLVLYPAITFFWKPTWHNFTLCFFTYAWVICSFTLSDHPSSSFTLDRFGKCDFFRNSEDIFWLHSSGVALKIPCMTIVYDFVFRNTGRTYFFKSDCVCMRLEGVD